MPSNQSSGSSSGGSRKDADMSVSEAASIMGRKGGQASHGGHGAASEQEETENE